jgi:hypothetical protein
VADHEEDLYDSACESIIDVARLHQGVPAVESERASFIILIGELSRYSYRWFWGMILAENKNIYAFVSVGIRD